MMRKDRRVEKMNKVIAVAFLLVLVSVGCITPESRARMNIFHGNFSVVGEPILNQEIELTYFVEPEIDVPNASMRIDLPDGIELIEGDLTWTGAIQKGERVEMKLRLKVVELGEWQIVAVSYYMSGQGKFSHSEGYFIYFTSSDAEGKISRRSSQGIPVSEKFKKAVGGG